MSQQTLGSGWLCWHQAGEARGAARDARPFVARELRAPLAFQLGAAVQSYRLGDAALLAEPGVMRCHTYWRRCPGCHGRIEPGDVQGIAAVAGHREWVCRTCLLTARRNGDAES